MKCSNENFVFIHAKNNNNIRNIIFPCISIYFDALSRCWCFSTFVRQRANQLYVRVNLNSDAEIYQEAVRFLGLSCSLTNSCRCLECQVIKSHFNEWQFPLLKREWFMTWRILSIWFFASRISFMSFTFSQSQTHTLFIWLCSCVCVLDIGADCLVVIWKHCDI